MKIETIFFLLFSFWATFAFSQIQYYDEEIRKKEQSLKETRGQLAASRIRAEELRGKEKQAFKELQQIQENLFLARKLVKELKEKESRLIEEVGFLSIQLDLAIEKLNKAEKIRAERLRNIYKHGRLSKMEMLLSSRSFVDIVKRYKYLSLISAQDRRLVLNLKEEKRVVEEKKSEVERAVQELKEVREEKEKEEKKIENERQEANLLAKKIRSSREEQEKMVEELEKTAKELEILISRLEKERKEAIEKIMKPVPEPTLGKIKGGVGWPTNGTVVSTFGTKVHPKYKTTIKNNGIDIQTTYGSPVKAVERGKVVFADKFLGYGKMILLDHGGSFYSLYGHLAEIFVGLGKIVKEGELIGSVGDSGSIFGPMLYFELRKGGKPVDPLQWLSRKK